MPAFWQFPARVERVVDGDTLDLTMDMGFRVQREVRVRLKGLDTAEVYGVKEDSDEYERGQEHAAFVADWVDRRQETQADWPFFVKTEKATGKYGRYIAVVAGPDGDVLNDDLVAEYPEVEDDSDG